MAAAVLSKLLHRNMPVSAGLLIDLLPTLLGYAQIAASVEFTLLPEDEPGVLTGKQWSGVRGGYSCSFLSRAVPS